MKTLRLARFVWGGVLSAGVLGVLAGCGPIADPPPPKLQPKPKVEAPPSPEAAVPTVQVVEGRVDFTQLRPRMEHVPEVLLVNAEQPETTEILEGHLERFQAYRTAQMDQGLSDEGLTREERLLRTQIAEAMSEEKREELEGAFQQLRRDFPPVQALDLPSGPQTPRTETVRPLWALFEKLNAYNFIRALPIIEQNLQAANQALLEEYKAQERGSLEAEQVQADLLWLETLVKYVNERLPELGRDYERLINGMYADLARHPDQEWVEALMDPIDRWEYYLENDLPKMRSYLASRLIASAPTDQQGTFRLEGGGSVIVRLALDGQELFVPEQTQALPLEIVDVQRRTEKRPVQSPSAEADEPVDQS